MVAARLGGRSGHYMPLSLLQSQFDALEPPGPEENPIVVSIALPVDEIVGEVALELRRAANPS
jgi:gluconokinase